MSIRDYKAAIYLTSPITVAFCLFVFVTQATNHMQSMADYIRVMTLISLSFCLVYIPLLWWQDRFLPKRWALFAALWLLMFSRGAGIMYNYGHERLTWYATPFGLASVACTIYFISLRMGDKKA